MFSQITMNWRGRPLVGHEVMIQLIAHTTTTTGLKVRAGLDRNHYPTGEKVSKPAWAKLRLSTAPLPGDWNYTMAPES